MQPPFALIDFPAGDQAPAGSPRGATRVFERPRIVLVAHRLDEVIPVLHAVDRQVAAGMHAVGFVAYEAAPAFDAAFGAQPSGPLPLAWFGIFDAPRGVPPEPETDAGIDGWESRTGRSEYDRAIESIRMAIERGDVYQVNYATRLNVRVRGSSLALYRELLRAQGDCYGAFLDLGRHQLLSASPELFFRRNGEAITCRPMKGTARRGLWTVDDDARRAQLAESAKERAENVMIVDLVRNDLGRIAQTGSVAVPAIFEVERRPTVFQMTSTVTARLLPGTTTADCFAALFPCGSVTGAPKVAATRAIAALEPDPRAAYCGAIGYVAPDGTSAFNVAIRTLWIDRETGRAEYGAGGGVTWDSAADREYDEMVAKAGLLSPPMPRFELVETMRLEDGVYARRDRHLDRLIGSAGYFGFPDVDGIARAAHLALDDHAHRPQAAQRVRLLAAPDGTVRLVTAPLPPALATPPVVALAAAPVRRDDPFLHHKTTHRVVHELHRAAHPDAFDTLLWNAEGEVTEFTIGNVVVELDGARWTPPRECGLLAGTFRAQLIEAGEVGERVIHRSELGRATATWLVNSVRESVRRRLGQP